MDSKFSYSQAESKEKPWPYAGVDYNLTLCPPQSRLQHIYPGQPFARVDFIPQSESLDLASEYISRYSYR